MDLTDSFTWEDLPTRDADSGQFTAAGWIPRIMKYTLRAAIGILCFHFGQSTIRIVTNHETMLIVWYPFDWTVSPFYELVNISQVTIYKAEFSSIFSYSNLNLTDRVNRHIYISFFSLSFVLSFFLPFFSQYRALVGSLTKRNSKNFATRHSWSNRVTEQELFCGTERKKKSSSITGISAGIQQIQNHIAIAVNGGAINYLLTYIQTPCSRFLLEKLKIFS